GRGVGDAMPSDVRGASVYRLEDRVALTDVGARRYAQATGQTGHEVGEDVAEEVGGHQDVEAARVTDQAHRGRVYDDVVRLDVRVLLPGDGHHRLEEETGGQRQHVGLVDDGDPALALPRLLHRHAGDPLRCPAGHDRVSDRQVPVAPLLLDVQAFRVLADHEHVDARDAVRERARARRPEVREQVEGAAHVADRALVALHLVRWAGERACEGRVGTGHLGEGICGHAGARSLERRPTGLGFHERQAEVGGFEEATRRGYHLLPDAVTGDEADRRHGTLLDAT